MTQPQTAGAGAPAGPRCKVLFLSAAAELGGAERSLYELLCALPGDRVEAHACVPPEGPLGRLCALAEVPVHPVPMRRLRRTRHPLILAGQVRSVFRGSQAVGALVRDLGVDLIHANTDSTALVAWEVSRELGRPFVWHCRDLRPLGALAKMLSRRSACAVAISEAVAVHLRRQGVPAARLRVILNGIDLARFHQPMLRDQIRRRTRRYLGVGEDTPLLLDIGAWVPWKKHELYLEALAAIRRHLPDAMGLLVGSDLFQENQAYGAQLERLTRRLRLAEGALLLLQQRDDIPDLMAAADLLVSPSENEPFGRVLVEAGAAQLPVVAADSGAKREIVVDGRTGFLTAPGDAGALAEASLKLLADPGLRRAMGERGCRRATALFDVRRTARQMADLYHELLAAHRNPPTRRK